MANSAITSYIFKIASRCNLACTYCYMYNGPDQSWRSLPKFMSLETATHVLSDIAHYAKSNGLSGVSIVFHGGEPLLFPEKDFPQLLSLIREILDDQGIESTLSIQTNATLSRPNTTSLLLNSGVGFGVSIDLTDESHDRLRVDKNGSGTSSRVKDGIAEIKVASGGSQPQGALLVIDPEVPPRRAFERLVELDIGFVDLLLPDQNWDTAKEDELAEAFGDWLLEFLDIYIRSARTFQVRWIQTAFKLALGGVWGSDSLGLNAAGTLIVDTDGSYDFHDVLRSASEAVNDTGLRGGTRSLASISELPLMRMMMSKEAHLPERCKSCAFAKVCGGGHIAHRYSSSREFDNPSVYCKAILPLYSRISELASEA